MKKRLISSVLTMSMFASFVPNLGMITASATNASRTYAEYATMSQAPEIPILPGEITSDMSYYDFVETYADNNLLPQNDGDKPAYTLSANPVFPFYTSGTTSPPAVSYKYVSSDILPEAPDRYKYDNYAEYLADYEAYCAIYKFYTTSGYKNTYFFTTSSYDGGTFVMNEVNGFGYDNNYNVGAYSYKSKTSTPKFTDITEKSDVEVAHLGSSSGYFNYVSLEGNSNGVYNWADYSSTVYGNEMYWMLNTPYHYWQADYRLAFRDTTAPTGQYATYLYSDGTDGLEEGHYLQVMVNESVRMSVLDSTYNWDDSFEISCTAVDMTDESTISQKLIGTSVLVNGAYFNVGETNDDGETALSVLTFKLDDEFLEEHPDIRITRVQSVEKESPLQLFSVQAYTQDWDILDVTNVDKDVTPVYSSYPITDLAGNALSIDIWASSQTYKYTTRGEYYSTEHRISFYDLDVDSSAPEIVSMDVALSSDDSAAWPVTSDNEWPANISRTLMFRSDEDTRNYKLTYYIDLSEAIDTTDDIYKNAYITGIYEGDDGVKYYATGIANDNTRLIFDIGTIPEGAVSANEKFYPSAFYPNEGIYDMMYRNNLSMLTTTPTEYIDTRIIERKSEMVGTIDITSITPERDIYLDTKAPVITLDETNMSDDTADNFYLGVTIDDTDGDNIASTVTGLLGTFKVKSESNTVLYEYAVTDSSIAPADESYYTSGVTGISYSFPIQDGVKQYIHVKGIETNSAKGSYISMEVSAADWALNSATAYTADDSEINIDKGAPVISTKYVGFGSNYYYTYVEISEDHTMWDGVFQYQWVKGTLDETEIDETAWVTDTYGLNSEYINSSGFDTFTLTETASLYVRTTDPAGNVTNYEQECTGSGDIANKYSYTCNLDEVQYNPSFIVSTPSTPSTVDSVTLNAATVVSVKYTDASGNTVYKAAEIDNATGAYGSYDLFKSELTWYDVKSHVYAVYDESTKLGTVYAILADGADANGVTSYGFTSDSLYSNVEIQVASLAYKSSYTFDMITGITTSNITDVVSETFTMKVSNSDETASSDVFGEAKVIATNVEFEEVSTGNSSRYYAASDLGGIMFNATISSNSKNIFTTGWESEIDIGRSEFVIAKKDSNSSPNSTGGVGSTVVYSENLTEASANQTFVIPSDLNLEDGLYEVYIKLCRKFNDYSKIDYVIGSTVDGYYSYYFIVENSGDPSYGLYGVKYDISGIDELAYEKYGTTNIISDGEQSTILSPLSEITLNLAPENTAASEIDITKDLYIGYETKNAATYFASTSTASTAVNFGIVAGLRVWNKDQIEDGSDIYLQTSAYTLNYGDDLSASTFYMTAYNVGTGNDFAEFGLVDDLSDATLLEKVQSEIYLPLVEGTNTVCVQLEMGDGTFTPTQEYTFNVITSTPELSVSETPVGLTEYNGVYYMTGLDVKLNYALSGIGGATAYAFESSIMLDDVNNIPTITVSMDGTSFQDGRWSGGNYTAGNQIGIVAADEYGGYSWYLADTDNYTYDGNAVILASLENMGGYVRINDGNASTMGQISIKPNEFEYIDSSSETPFLKSLDFINNDSGAITNLYKDGEYLNQDYVDYYNGDSSEETTFTYTNGFYDYGYSGYEYRIPYIDTMADGEEYDLSFTIRATSIFGETYELEYSSGSISMWPNYGYPISTVNLAPGLSTDPYTIIISPASTSGIYVILNDLLTMVYPASTDGTTYSFEHDNLPIYEAGTYTFIYEDVYGVQYAQDVEITADMINSPATDTTAPSVTFAHSSMQEDTTYGAVTYYNSETIDDGLSVLSESIGEKLELEISDMSDADIIIKSAQIQSVSYGDESDDIFGVTVDGETITVANAAIFYVYVVDASGNVSETFIDFTSAFGDWTDTVVPSVTAYVTPLNQTGDTTGEAETVYASDFADAVTNMSKAWQREIKLSITDYSATKIVVKSSQLTDVAYETASSDTISGVAVSGDTITVSEGVVFYIYIIDAESNYTELYADMTAAVGELDEDAPVVTIGFKEKYIDSYEEEYTTKDLADVEDYVETLEKAVGYQLYLNITDKSATKTILRSEEDAEISYSSTSDTITGVSHNGDIIEITESASFYIYIVDSSNNVSSTFIDMTGKVASSDEVTLSMPTILYETLTTGGKRAYLIPQAGSSFTCTNATDTAVPSGYSEAYYYYDFTTNGSFTFNLVNDWGTTRNVTVTVSDVSDIEISETKWTSNNTSGAYTNSPITATVTSDRYIVKAELDCEQTVATVTFSSSVAYVQFVDNPASEVTLTLTDSGKNIATIKLAPSATIDKDAPVITLSSQEIGDNLDSMKLTFSANEPVIFSQNDTPTSEYASADLVKTVTANGDYNFAFTDEAGNTTIQAITVESIDTLDLILEFSKNASGDDSVTDTRELTLDVGDSIYAKSNKTASFIDANVENPQSSAITADLWTMLTEIKEAPEEYPMYTFTSTTTVGDITKDWILSAVFTEVTLKDTKAPVITLATKYLEATTIDNVEAIIFANATAIDNVDGNVSVSIEEAIPSSVGTHTITYTATDAAGNTGTTSGYITLSLSTDIKLTINGTQLAQNGLYTLRSDGEMQINMGTDEPYSVYYINNHYIASQLKIFGTVLAYNTSGNQTFQTSQFGSGYSTILIRMQDRTEYIFYVYRS